MADDQARFDALQAKLVPLWGSIESFNPDPQTIVVVPALPPDIFWGSRVQAYEERYLFLLLLLRQPRARMIYLTSLPIDPAILDYYFGLLLGVIPSHARERLFTLAPGDASDASLSDKVLARPRLLERIRGLIPDPDRAHLVPFFATERERRLALALGIPMYAADPRFSRFGTKSGCRRLFAEEGVVHPAGREDLRDLDDVVDAIVELRAERPGMRSAIVKHDEGVSGMGNATVALEGLPEPGSAAAEEAVADRVRGMATETGEPVETYGERFAAEGGVVEERVEGPEVRSPSVQMRVTPLGVLEMLSTHDQLLGGPSGQSYLGARFPADPEYATAISREARKVGERLAAEGVIGRFAVDFVVVRGEKGWDPFAIELNLRKGGTTHPFLTVQFLTDGVYDEATGVFTAPSGRAKSFVASDHVESDAYRGLTPTDLFDVAVRHGLHFDPARQCGVVFHMMTALPEYGQTGLTAVGDSAEEADELYRRTVSVLDEETRGAYAPDA
ncbi:MAG TPA: peptide ligase PGM1-related protein [Actinomycetota bacterium]|nr:peptide ligase PGM1-related protein [Actinomycetota bacterium]